MTTETLLTVQIALMTILLLKEYLTSFIKEKGKNLATKQDIKEITNRIEDAKIFYSTKLETVKASLQINTFEQNKIVENSLCALLDFYDVSISLLHDNLSRNFGDFTSKDLDTTLLEFQNQTENLFIKQKILYHRLIVFLGTEKEIILSAHSVLESSQKSREVLKKHFGSIKIALAREKEALGTSEDIWRHAVSQTDIHTTTYSTEANPIIIDLHNNLYQFTEILISYLKRKDFL